MKFLKIAVLAATLLSGGCAGDMAWQRADGGRVDRSFVGVAAECRERAQEYGRDGGATEVMRRCMRRHGYVWAAVSSNGYYGDDD
jgi:alkanesulfonate monooxygenase SsuD/methylene tetrahydromethanopterin reductase-like flavin-dependent oxidoreductase (luciferase family)